MLLAMLIGKWSGLAVDGYVGLVVALFILFSAYKARIPSASAENATSSGWRILSKEDLASSTPISRISRAGRPRSGGT